MNAKILDLTNQVFRLVYVVRNISYHRSLEKHNDSLEQNYWIIIYNNFLDVAVLEWCKVFGSRNNATHWSKNVIDQDAFREGLLARLQITQQEWEEYWEQIKGYRDKYVAHHEFSPKISQYPDFNYALVSCYFYYEILIKELRLLNVYDYPDDLKEYYNNSLDQAKELSDVAHASTLNINERVF